MDKNVCRIHDPTRSVGYVRSLDSLTRRLVQWTDSLGKATVDRSNSFLLLRGGRDDPCNPVQRIVLLNDAKYSPKAQQFINCVLEVCGPLFYRPSEAPFPARIHSGALSRLGGG